jgi:hypothetical protein
VPVDVTAQQMLSIGLIAIGYNKERTARKSECRRNKLNTTKATINNESEKFLS